MSSRKINVAIVGLGFGAEFIPIYQRHPDASMYAICQRTRKKLDAIGDAFGVERRHTDFKELLKDPDLDARPNYWPGLLPMWYATHCVGPMLALTKATAEYVSCFGSGTIRKELIKCYNSPFAVETAHIKFKNSGLSARIYRSLFDTARQYRESIDVYGSKKSFEWTLIEHEPHVLHTAKLPEPKIPRKVKAPDYAKLLPKPIRRFTTKGVYDSAKKAHLSFTQGAGHGGSHPHMVHEFLTALVKKRDPFPNAKQSANWTCVGLGAHKSALN